MKNDIIIPGIPGAKFESYQIRKVALCKGDKGDTWYEAFEIAGNGSTVIGSTYGIYGMLPDGIVEHVADRAELEDAYKLLHDIGVIAPQDQAEPSAPKWAAMISDLAASRKAADEQAAAIKRDAATAMAIKKNSILQPLLTVVQEAFDEIPGIQNLCHYSPKKHFLNQQDYVVVGFELTCREYYQSIPQGQRLLVSVGDSLGSIGFYQKTARGNLVGDTMYYPLDTMEDRIKDLVSFIADCLRPRDTAPFTPDRV